MQIVDGNAKTDVSNRREPGMFCGEAEQPQTFISETSYVKIVFYAENYTDQVCEHFKFDRVRATTTESAENYLYVHLCYGGCELVVQL